MQEDLLYGVIRLWSAAAMLPRAELVEAHSNTRYARSYLRLTI
jgi:hypothetical protein